jgi:hypothetical protein
MSTVPLQTIFLYFFFIIILPPDATALVTTETRIHELEQGQDVTFMSNEGCILLDRKIN